MHILNTDVLKNVTERRFSGFFFVLCARAVGQNATNCELNASDSLLWDIGLLSWYNYSSSQLIVRVPFTECTIHLCLWTGYDIKSVKWSPRPFPKFSGAERRGRKVVSKIRNWLEFGPLVCGDLHQCISDGSRDISGFSPYFKLCLR